MDTADLIRRARSASGMKQAQLASATGVAPAALCRYERGRRVPSVATLVRLLEATGHQVSSELEPLDADLVEPLERAQQVPVDEREGALLWGWAGTWLTELPHRVEGLAALSIMGAPVRCRTLDIALAPSTADWARFARAVREYHATLVQQGMRVGWRPTDPGELAGWAMESPREGRFEAVLGVSPGRVRVVGPEVVERHVPVMTRWGAAPVAPLLELEVGDRQARRVLRLLRERAVEPRR